MNILFAGGLVVFGFVLGVIGVIAGQLSARKA